MLELTGTGLVTARLIPRKPDTGLADGLAGGVTTGILAFGFTTTAGLTRVGLVKATLVTGWLVLIRLGWPTTIPDTGGQAETIGHVTIALVIAPWLGLSPSGVNSSAEASIAVDTVIPVSASFRLFFTGFLSLA